MFDVIVVGAGPGGLSAARALAAEGRSVLVLEEHDTVGQPVHCTGLLGIEAFDELDLPRETIRTVLGSARFRGAGGRSVAVDAQGVAAAVVDRARVRSRPVAAGAGGRRRRPVRPPRASAISIDARRVEIGATTRDGRDGSFRAGRACWRAARSTGSIVSSVSGFPAPTSRRRKSKRHSRRSTPSRSIWIARLRRAALRGWFRSPSTARPPRAWV